MRKGPPLRKMLNQTNTIKTNPMAQQYVRQPIFRGAFTGVSGVILGNEGEEFSVMGRPYFIKSEKWILSYKTRGCFH